MKHSHGFTLIELMVTIAILAIVLTIGVPSFQTVIQNNRLVSQYNDTLTSITTARSEAIKNGTTITMCGSTNSTACNTTSWELGWIVFTDSDADRVVDAGVDTLLRVGYPFNGNNTLRTVSFANAGFIQYSSTGLMVGSNTGTFKVCDPRGAAFARAVNINAVGRVSRAEDTNASGTVNDVDGTDVACP